jgi:hemolysin III
MSAHAAATEGATRPRLRGVSQQAAFFFALGATAALIGVAPPGLATRSALVFGASLVALFGVSALFHSVRWAPRQHRWMQRLDHAAIFVSIAGGHTPLFAMVPSSRGGHGAVAFVWAAAALGVAKSLAWPQCPPWLSSLLCAALGWACAGQVFDRAAATGWAVLAPFVASGVVFTVGAVVYATRRPDPAPKVFGYHEVFHALVVLGSVSLFGHVWLLLRACRGDR